MSDRKQAAPDGYLDPDMEERDDAIIGVALRWSLAVLLVLVLSGAAVAYWLTRPEPPPPVRKTELAVTQLRKELPIELPTVIFRDITPSAGIDFVHENGAYGDKLLPETMGGGIAFLDCEGDGDQDIVMVNSMRWPWDPRPAAAAALSRLYLNDGRGQFTDATAGSGLDQPLYGMGVAVGDYDNDGLADLFISAVGKNRLLHNEGHGRFRDVTEEAAVAGAADAWSSSCGWFDYDNDGDLDLFVCNYLQWSKQYDLAQNFQLTGGGRAYGRPQNFEGTFSYLYRNEGHGAFTDVSASAGIQVRNPATGVPMGKSLGLAFADFDSDGWLDIVVANDTVQNFFFHNLGNGSFQELGAMTGVAFDMNGNARGAMGIDVSRFRNNSAIGIAIGNFANEMTALYVANDSKLSFIDEAIPTGLGPNTRQELTFGLFYFDYDLDGRLDLLATNGHLEEDINRVQPSQHYEQPPQLFWNCGPQHGTEFLPVPESKCGPDLVKPMVGRGAAYADIDADGDLDVLLMALGRAPRLLRNDQQLQHHWLRLKLTGSSATRDAIGAWVEVQLDDEHTLWQQVMPTRSYLSQCELPVTFGLGDAAAVQDVVVHWPGGGSQRLGPVEVDQELSVEQTQ